MLEQLEATTTLLLTQVEFSRVCNSPIALEVPASFTARYNLGADRATIGAVLVSQSVSLGGTSTKHDQFHLFTGCLTF